PDLYNILVEIQNQYGWIKHWGFPPFKSASTLEDILFETLDLIKRGDANKFLAKDEYRSTCKQIRKKIIQVVQLDKKDIALLDTIVAYKHFRTWRMERFIQSEVELVPFFREVERRLISKGYLKETDDIFFLTIPEIIRLLRDKAVQLSPSINERRLSFGLYYHNGLFHVLTKEKLKRHNIGFKSILWDVESRRAEIVPTRTYVGGKAESLCRISKLCKKSGWRVPKFFVITTLAYDYYVNNPEDIKNITNPDIIHKKTMDSIKNMITETVKEFGTSYFAVRSSSTLEDEKGSSFAGVFHSVLRVSSSKDNLFDAIGEVWDSCNNATAEIIANQLQKKLSSHKMAVIIQEMVNAKVSGVIDTDVRQIGLHRCEAVLGLGDQLVSGTVTPEVTFLIKTTEDGYEITDCRGNLCILNSDQLRAINLAIEDIRGYFGENQNIEWCWDDNGLAILQVRPRLDSIVKKCHQRENYKEHHGRILVEGLAGGAAKSIRGIAIVMEKPQPERMQDDFILVSHTVTPEWDPIIIRAKALVVDEGGITSHAIRIADELGIPAVVNGHVATQAINDGQEIIVDTTDLMSGKVYSVMTDLL
ncbi:MAG: hypothetical protein FVQ84_18935, partial [Planctomycetes bacterium]|nr:hypothetical protein [Planctomycetota bacterium]